MTNVKTIRVWSEDLPKDIAAAAELPPGIEFVGNAHSDAGTVLYSCDGSFAFSDASDLSPYAFSCIVSDAQFVSNAEIASRIAEQFSSAVGSEREKVFRQALSYLMHVRSSQRELTAVEDPIGLYQDYLDLWQNRCAHETQHLADLVNRLASARADAVYPKSKKRERQESCL